MLLVNAGTQICGSLGLLLVVLSEGPLWMLLPAFLLNGLGGGTPVFTALTMGSLADGTRTEAERSMVFGYVTCVSMVSNIIAPEFGGLLTRTSSSGKIFTDLSGGTFQIIFVLFFVGNLVVFGSEYAFLPETLSSSALMREKTKKFSYWSITFGSLSILKIKQLRNLFLIYCCVVLALDPMTNLEILYATLRFQMRPDQIGVFISGAGFFRAFSVLFIFSLLLKLIAPKRRALVLGLRVGISTLVVATACFGLSHSGRSLSAVFALEGLDGLWQVSISTLFSLVGEELGLGQGQVLSLISFASSLFFTVSPVIFNIIWSLTVEWWPSFTFHVITACACVGLALTTSLSGHSETENSRESLCNDVEEHGQMQRVIN